LVVEVVARRPPGRSAANRGVEFELKRRRLERLRGRSRPSPLGPVPDHFTAAAAVVVDATVGRLQREPAGPDVMRVPGGKPAAVALASVGFFVTAVSIVLACIPPDDEPNKTLAVVKVVVGFLVLAASLKYLSGADQAMQWGVLTRERFLALWIALFTMVGIYLLGLLRLQRAQRDESMGIGRLLTAVAFLAFAVNLIPGMLGSPPRRVIGTDTTTSTLTVHSQNEDLLVRVIAD